MMHKRFSNQHSFKLFISNVNLKNTDLLNYKNKLISQCFQPDY